MPDPVTREQGKPLKGLGSQAGNTAVIKPSPFTPLVTLRKVELLGAVFPPGVLNVIGGDEALGAALGVHPPLKKVIR